MASSISVSSARQLRLMCHRALVPAAGTTNPASDRVAGRAKFANTSIDRAARQASRRRGRHEAAIAMRQCFVGGKQSPATLVKEFRSLVKARPNVVHINHPVRLANHCRVGPTEIAIRFLRAQPLANSFISRRVLRAWPVTVWHWSRRAYLRLTDQISLAYSLIALSEENQAALAIFMMLLRHQRAGCTQAAATSACASV